MGGLQVAFLLLLFNILCYAEINFPIEFENVNDIPDIFKTELKKSPIESGIRSEASEAFANVTLKSFTFDENHQKAKVVLDVSIAWKDERLKLNIPWKNGARRKIYPETILWHPNITHATSKTLEMDAWIGYLYVENEFNVTYQGIPVEMHCEMEYRWFPFDSHLCYFGLKLSKFQAWHSLLSIPQVHIFTFQARNWTKFKSRKRT